MKSINEQANVEVRKLLLSLWFVVTDGGAAPEYSNNDTKQQQLLVALTATLCAAQPGGRKQQTGRHGVANTDGFSSSVQIQKELFTELQSINKMLA